MENQWTPTVLLFNSLFEYRSEQGEEEEEDGLGSHVEIWHSSEEEVFRPSGGGM